jgi:hypothetical protein
MSPAVRAGTLRSILRQADWTVDDLTEHLK